MSECNCKRLQGEKIERQLEDFGGLERVCLRENIDLMDLSDRDSTLMDLGKMIMKKTMNEA